MWDDYGVIRPGRMPFDVYENGQIVFTQNPVAFDAQIGTVVGTIAVINAAPTYKLSAGKNPYFAISGNNLISKATLVGGVDFVQIFAIKGFKRIVQVVRVVVSGDRTPIPPTPPVGVFSVGVNFSGMEDSGAQNGSFVTSLAEMNYYAIRGLTSARLPLGWGFLQATKLGALNSTYCGFISQIMANAATAGVTLIPDIHNFGAGPDGNTKLTSADIAAFVDLWLKFSAFLRADPNYHVIQGYDPMNEWSNMDPLAGPGVNSTPASQALILSLNSAVMTALRGVGDHTKLYLEWDHFSGAWDAVANNIHLLFSLILSDPANNSIASVHCYLDNDSSGSNYSWANEIAKPGLAPPGTPTSINIFAERMAAVVALAASMGVRLHVGETGWSNDALALGGSDDYADWNQAGFNALTYAQANNIEYHYFAGGPGFGPSYGYYPGPSATSFPFGTDFSSAGLQSTQMVILEKFTGYTGAQPLAYRADLPFSGLAYSPSGTPLGGLKLRYNGHIPATVTFTGSAATPDGTDVGGTFGAMTMPLGDNAISTFSYTPAGSFAGINLTFTNDKGLTNPPAIGVSSLTDFFTARGSVATNIYSLRRLYNGYVGPAIRLQRDSDGAQANFPFNTRGDLPRQAIQDFLGSRSGWIVTFYDQSPAHNDLSWSSAFSGSGQWRLNLVDADSYPSAVALNGPKYLAGTPNRGLGQITVYSDINPVSGGGFIASQDRFSDNFRLTAGAWDVANNGGGSGPTFLSVTITTNAWQDIAGTYSNLYGTNNQKTYTNATLGFQGNAPLFTFQNSDSIFTVGNFDFGSIPYVGSMRTLILHSGQEYTATDFTNLHSQRATYYSTSLPDSLTAAPPVILGGNAAQSIFGGSGNPFAGVTIQDQNSGSPTDTVTLTLSGAAGTLSGTGITGTNPYTIAAASAASVTATLQALTFTGTGGTGAVTNVAIAVVSSAGTSASASMPVTLSAFGIETAFTPPGGTFTPIGNFKGYMLGGPDVTGNPTFFPFNAQIDYMAAQGFGILKLPTTQSNAIQGPSPFQPWVVSYVNNMKAVADYAFSKGMYVLIAFYDQGNSLVGTNSYDHVGISTTATNSFADQRSRIASRFKNYPNVLIEMTNEPKNQSITQWFAAQNIGVKAIRDAGFTGKIVIVPNGFQQADSFVSSGNAALYVAYAGDTLNNFVFGFHNYLDSGNTGETTVAQVGRGSTVLVSATSWLNTNGYQGILTEFGIAPDPFKPNPGKAMSWLNSASSVTTNMAVEGPALLSYMKTNSTQWLGWTEFAGGVEFATLPSTAGGFTDGGYGFNPEPARAGFAYQTPLTPNTQVIGILAAGL